MKKNFVLLLTVVFLLASLAGCSQSAASTDDGEKAPESEETSNVEASTETVEEDDGIFAGIEPLDEPVKLKIAMLSPGVDTYIPRFIEKLGGYEAVGIEPEFFSFDNGPAMVEAIPSKAWDVGMGGMGLVNNGVLRHGMPILGATTFNAAKIALIMPPEHPVIQAGQVSEDYPTLYGTPETWKGTEICIPTGTSVHYMTAKLLNIMGLTEDDVTINHMTVKNAQTALRAGQIECSGGWGRSNFKLYDEGFVMAANLRGVDASVYVCLVANPNVYEDPEMKEAIDTYVKLHYATVDWILANFDEYLEDLAAYCDATGYNLTIEDALRLTDPVTGDSLVPLDRAYELATTIDEETGMTLLQKSCREPMVFFTSIGNYTQEEMDKFDEILIDTSSLEEYYESKK